VFEQSCVIISCARLTTSRNGLLTLLSIPHSLLYRPMLYDLFTSDIIFDKFEICCSPDGKKFASGSYRYALFVPTLLLCAGLW
jgi:hypothetical protein